MQKKLLLTDKKQLTHDVYELTYTGPVDETIQPGSFLLFDFGGTLQRAYSIASYKDGVYSFIVKRVENGEGGSKAMCDMDIGIEVPVIGPMGHFLLQKNSTKKVFIGTGTGFAPLYYQMKEELEQNSDNTVHFVFGVRYYKDVFYVDILESWQKMYPNFSYTICLSRPDDTTPQGFEYSHGYVTSDGVFEMDNFEEFYICGSPAMVMDMKKNLENKGVQKEQVFFEQY